MQKLFILKICLLTIVYSGAQRTSWGFTFTPSVVNTHSPHYGLQAGAECRFGSRLSLVTEFTTLAGGKPQTSASDEQFFRIKPELRYFLSGDKRHRGNYAGISLSYSARSWKANSKGNYWEGKFYQDSAITYQSAALRSPVFTSAAQLGTLFTIGEHLGIDLFLGAGVRVIRTTYTDVQGAGKTYSVFPKCKIMFSPDPAWWVNGTITRFHCHAGLRFLFRF